MMIELYSVDCGVLNFNNKEAFMAHSIDVFIQYFSHYMNEDVRVRFGGCCV